MHNRWSDKADAYKYVIANPDIFREQAFSKFGLGITIEMCEPGSQVCRYVNWRVGHAHSVSLEYAQCTDGDDVEPLEGAPTTTVTFIHSTVVDFEGHRIGFTCRQLPKSKDERRESVGLYCRLPQDLMKLEVFPILCRIDYSFEDAAVVDWDADVSEHLLLHDGLLQCIVLDGIDEDFDENIHNMSRLTVRLHICRAGRFFRQCLTSSLEDYHDPHPHVAQKAVSITLALL
jgi:hypothetical protein